MDTLSPFMSINITYLALSYNPPSSSSANLTWTNVAIGLGFILFDAGLSSLLRLGIGISLLVASLRCMGQLALVATVLQGVFERKDPWSVVGIVCMSSSFIGKIEIVEDESGE